MNNIAQLVFAPAGLSPMILPEVLGFARIDLSFAVLFSGADVAGRSRQPRND